MHAIIRYLEYIFLAFFSDACPHVQKTRVLKYESYQPLLKHSRNNVQYDGLLLKNILYLNNLMGCHYYAQAAPINATYAVVEHNIQAYECLFLNRPKCTLSAMHSFLLCLLQNKMHNSYHVTIIFCIYAHR